jgi:RNA polymerase sigma-70 factor (ECF subfamily)
MTLTDQHIERIKSGDIQAFKEVYHNMFKSLCLYGYKMLSDEDVVQDVVQEAFVVLWNRREEYNSMIGAKGYLYTVVRNRIINVLRERKIEAAAEPELEEVEFNNQITKEETYKLLHQAISSLPEQTQNVIKLSMNGHTNPEIAEELGVTVNTVKTLKKRAYSKLREQLKENIFLLMLLTDILS